MIKTKHYSVSDDVESKMNEGNALKSWLREQLADSSIECNSQPWDRVFCEGPAGRRVQNSPGGAERSFPDPHPKTLICFLAFSRGFSPDYFLCCDIGTALLESVARCFLDRAFSTAPSSGGATGHQATLVLLAAKTLFPGVARVKKSKWQNQT